MLAVKMVLVNEFCDKCLVLGLLSLALTQVLTVSGQQGNISRCMSDERHYYTRSLLTHTDGAFLELLGVNLPSDSLVEVRDIYDSSVDGENPTPFNNRPTLHCFTDLVNCCNTPRATGIGEWYFPNGTSLDFDFPGVVSTFRRNRGPNGVFGGETILGVVRLFRRGLPPERGRFRCEIPTAANPTVNQILYVNICELT